MSSQVESDRYDLWKLFAVEEYPDDVAENALPQDTFYEYISSTFLNGLINYVKIFATYLILNKDQGEKVSEEAIEELRKSPHTHLGNFDVMVTVLAETEDSFWVFCYDPDVSDCGIGRCSKAKMSCDDFEALFLTSIYPSEQEIKLSWKPTGWVSF